MKRIIHSLLLLISILSVIPLYAQPASRPLAKRAGESPWIPISREARPYTRWWWLGSAVDSAGLAYNLGEFARVGIGGVEITPIYGVQGNDRNDIPYLSSRWMQMFGYTLQLGRQYDIEIDMATGTGWPFGGPGVSKEDAACRAIFTSFSHRDDVQLVGNGVTTPLPTREGQVGGSLTIGRTGQKVKRAAPGGEGFVIDHFDRRAVHNYLSSFTAAFNAGNTPRPHTFFNDSYEVYGADWTPRLLDEFAQRRGYRLENHFPDFLLSDSLCSVAADSVADIHRLLLSDYRETLGELLLENFTIQWTDWAHSQGAITRNQAHGSPANLIDIYAAVDIPECEGFGLSDFGIKGLRTDPGYTKKNDSDISMLKYASSAAHITGKPFTSSETFTWLTEHFRTSLSQCKPDLDLMFLAGVNHVVFHGSCYSPKDEPWPGWRFYASVDMTPYNPQWNAMPAFCDYISRTQAFLQWGEPDNDFLVYLPFYDMIYEQPDRLVLFDIHSMDRRAPKFIHTIQAIIRSGYDVDYISDRYLLTDAWRHYDAVIVPDVRFMPVATINRLQTIAAEGKRVIFVGHYPESVPGYGRLTTEAAQFEHAMSALKAKAMLARDYEEALALAGGRIERMRTDQHLSCIRRTNPEGHHYFISNLTPNDVDAYVALGVDFADALFYNPMTGAVTHPDSRDGQVRLQLASGESIILRTFRTALRHSEAKKSHPYVNSVLADFELHNWELTFPGDIPMNAANNDTACPQNFTATWIHMNQPQSWTELGGKYPTRMATGCYTTTFSAKRNKTMDGCHHILDLGDVRESARVVLNGKEVATLFAVPFRCDITPYIKKGKNTLKVYVTNLPANRIAQMDRDSIPWRHFKEINVVDLNYKRDHYDSWTPMPSGLCSPVRIFSVK